MADAPDLIHVGLQLVLKDGSADDVDVESRRLRMQLREADFSITEAGQTAPIGSKSPEAFTLGALTVALLPKVVPQLIEVLGRWLGTKAERKLKMKLPNGLECELTGSMSNAEAKELIDRLISKGAKAGLADK